MQNSGTLIFILIGITFFLSCSGSSTSNNCSLYKEGIFYFHPKNGSKIVHYTITRKGSAQTEKNEEDGNIGEYKIHWTDYNINRI